MALHWGTSEPGLSELVHESVAVCVRPGDLARLSRVACVSSVLHSSGSWPPRSTVEAVKVSGEETQTWGGYAASACCWWGA